MKKTLRNHRISSVDIAAILAFLALWIYFIIRIRYFFCFPDEFHYPAVAERFVFGDRPLVDEWHLIQLSCIFFVVPYRLYVSVTGGTAGIILFMRVLFLAVNAVFYWFMYLKLRAYKWTALIATLMFSLFIPGGMQSCNYYTMAVRMIMIICLILFSEKQTAVSLSAAGILLACAGIYQPLLFPLYLAYSVLVWVRYILKKRGSRFCSDFDFCLNLRAWKYITASACLCIGVCMVWLIARSGLRNILTVIPNLLFTDPEHDASSFGFENLKKTFGILGTAVNVFGYICVICGLLILVLSIAYSFGVFQKRRGQMKKILLYSSCAVWALSCVTPLFYARSPMDYTGWFHVPLLSLGFVCYLLCEHKNKKCFVFWIVGLCVSICVNLIWTTDLSYGFSITYFADLVFFADLVREVYSDRTQPAKKRPVKLRQLKKEKRIRALVRYSSIVICICSALYLIVSAVIVNTVIPGAYYFKATASTGSLLMEKGPARNLYYPNSYGNEYNKKLSDIDSFKQKNPKNIFVFGLSPELYLYAQQPFAGACVWTLHTAADLKQHIRYWNMHPDNLPECIYIPVDSLFNAVNDPSEFLSWVRDSFDRLCTYSLEEGESGYILYVNGWNPDALRL